MGRRILGLLVGSLLGVFGVVAVLPAQTFPTPIAEAIALLTTGVTPFSIVGVDASGYINFSTGRSDSGYGFRDNGGVMQVKNSGGSWANFTTSGGAPSTAGYITKTAEASLSNEFALASLATALLVNTTTTGVPTAYTGSSCGANTFATSISAIGAVTCAAVTSSGFSGTMPVVNGGSGAATLTGILIGNGTSAFTAATSSTAGQVLRVTGANTFAYGAVDLDDTDAVTGTLGVSNGGTNLSSGTSGGILGYTASGTLASSVALTDSVIVVGGGAGSTPTPLAAGLGSTNTVLHGNAGGEPTWAAVDISADTTGSLGVARGGTGIASYTVGDLITATGTTTLSAIAASNAGKFLRATGAASAPVWSTTIWTNSATTGDLLYASGSNTYANLPIGASDGMFLRVNTGVPTWSTLTLPNTVTQGDLLTATGADAVGVIAAVATGRVLVSAGTSTVPAWSTAPSAATFTASTAFIGRGTASGTGSFRLANTEMVASRDAGDTADVSMLALSAADLWVAGDTEVLGLRLTGAGGNIEVRTQDPTISSGFGTTPSITGQASAFRVTVGSGGDTSGVVLFNVTWPNRPVCIAQNETAGGTLLRTTTTTSQVTITGTLAASDIVSTLCYGY